MRYVGKEMRGLASRWTASRSGRISIVYTALVQAAPSGSIQAGGEPACPATGHAQAMTAFLKARLLHRYSMAPCQGSGCIFST